MPIHWHVLRRADRGRDGIGSESKVLQCKVSSFSVLVGDVSVEVSSMMGIERLVMVVEVVLLVDGNSLVCLEVGVNLDLIVEKSSSGTTRTNLSLAIESPRVIQPRCMASNHTR